MPDPSLPTDEAFLAVALAIADGAPVDWSALERTSHDDSSLPNRTASVVAGRSGLEELERVVRGHRELLEQPQPSTQPSETLLTAARREIQSGPGLHVRWGPLIVLEKVGRGTFGDVYRAFDPRLDREVALKLLREESSRRFGSPVIEEGRLLARVRHPNVVTVFGAEQADGRVGIWMEFVRGRTLATEVRENGPMKPDDAVSTVLEVCHALQAVHAAGLLHRDVKAHNVMRGTTGRIVLGDFGTGLSIEQSTSAPDRDLAGTPLYLAPEVLGGRPASIASDLYSLGVLLYFLLSGRHPVEGQTLTDIRQRHAAGTRTLIDVHVGDLDPDLTQILETLLDRDQTRRYQTAANVAAALQGWLSARAARQSDPPEFRGEQSWRHTILAASLVSAIAVGALGTYALRDRLGGGSGRRAIVPAGGPLSQEIADHACSGMPAADGTIACVELMTHLLDRGGQPPAPLVLYRPQTGEMRELRRTSGGERLMNAVISSDGQRVAYTVATQGQPTEVHVISTTDGSNRVLARLPEWASMLAVVGWSSHDDLIECRVWGKDGSHNLALLSPDSGALQPAFQFPVVPQTFARSRDGLRIAFDRRQSDSAPERDIQVCALGTRDCAVVAAHPANDVSPIWAPDGRLLFVSDRSGVMGLWSVALDGVSARQPPDLVRDTGRSRPGPIGFDAEGTLFYDLSVDQFDIYESSLGGSDLLTPVRLSPRAVDTNNAPVWSPDGRHIAYISQRGPFAESGATRLVIQDLEDRREREFRFDVKPNMTRLAWSPDGQALAMRTLLGPGPPSSIFGIHLISTADGQLLKTLTRKSPPERFVEDQIGDLVWLDAANLLFSSHRGIRRFEVGTGMEHPVWSPAPGQVVEGLALSPDASQMALFTVEGYDDPQRAILRTMVVPTAGGAARELFRSDPPHGSEVHAWTADGTALLVTRWASRKFSDRRFELWRVPVDGGASTRLPLSNPQIGEVSTHRDGRRIAFVMGAPRTEFWVMTGIDWQ